MTTYSETDFAVRVLRDLGVLDADETPRASDLNWAKETIASEVAMLGAINIPVWNGSELAIPSEYLTVLSRRVGLAIEPSFGLSSIAQSQMAMREAERYLTMMASPRLLSPRSLRADDAKRVSTNYDHTAG